ncbi:hypothetical protein ABZ912_22975 [Nonomuraea angiospora]|uniref:hypothetical protein n=1 Tax=Nonomuraea angiospora TaxID=46172 RepID=UPI0033DF2BEE
MLVLGIEVPDDLLRRWLGWFAPPVQPFAIPPDLAGSLELDDDRGRLTPEVRDTFCLYGLGSSALVWLTEAGARRLPASVRRSQPTPHRWPGSIAGREVETVVAYVEKGRRPSRHGDVAPATWDAIACALPRAQHAAVTLGDGWALHKPSQGWMSPTKVLASQDLKYSARARGQRLHRRHLR